jgi:hypothetical protein
MSPSGTTPAIDRYLAEVQANLPGSAGHRSAILTELRSGLLDAMDAHASAGLVPVEAARAAVREFGDPVTVARGFRAEIAARTARRVAVGVLVSGPLVGLLWIITAAASQLTPRWHLSGLSPGIQVGLVLVAAAAAATAICALLGVATTGRLTRWFSVRPGQAPAAAAAAGLSAVWADGLGLALLTIQLAVAPGKLSPVPAAAAAAASIIRLTLARRAARRCLAIRAELT